MGQLAAGGKMISHFISQRFTDIPSPLYNFPDGMHQLDRGADFLQKTRCAGLQSPDSILILAVYTEDENRKGVGLRGAKA